jgi:hypothetical protein
VVISFSYKEKKRTRRRFILYSVVNVLYIFYTNKKLNKQAGRPTHFRLVGKKEKNPVSFRVLLFTGIAAFGLKHLVYPKEAYTFGLLIRFEFIIGFDWLAVIKLIFFFWVSF